LSANPPAPAFAARRVTKRFGRSTALRDVDFELPTGTCHVLFGRNGAGKSTLLGIASTLLRPTSGEIFFEGRSYEEAGDEVRRHIGLVSHQSFLYPDLTVLENLEFYGRLYQVSSRASDALEWADLDLRRHSTVRSLSRGMLQRLSLARALLHRPRLLLLDEPYTGLDAASSERLSVKLFDLKGETSVLLTTHDVDRGVALADRISILEGGRIVFDATGATSSEVKRLLLGIREIVQ
jgi:heme ABC exporter ATP-binding subunit CcmA